MTLGRNTVEDLKYTYIILAHSVFAVVWH